MAFQPSVVEYFNNRKRPAEDLKTSVSKKLMLDPTSCSEKEHKSGSDEQNIKFPKKLVYSITDTGKCLQNKKTKSVGSKSKINQSRSVAPSNKIHKTGKEVSRQLDIRSSLLKFSNDNNSRSEEKRNTNIEEIRDNKSDQQSSTPQEDGHEPIVPFHFKGPLSPCKEKKLSETSDVREGKAQTDIPQSSTDSTEVASTSNSRKDLNLGRIKAMMSRSSRLEEMKAALQRFNENKAKLSEEQASTGTGADSSQASDSSLPVSPPRTPKKGGGLLSPQMKLTPCSLFSTPPRVAPASPLKSPLKSPAFQRYQALVTEGRPVLELPFKYRALAELFRCIDTVASMIHNTKETITLSNLKPGVQEISRKNLTEYQLGQIKTLFPDAFDFKLEKMRAYGSSEKYELVIIPLLGKEQEEADKKHEMMTPSILLARRRTLFNILLELTKNHHEEFLKSLDPPMCIPRSRLTRWHPEFMVDDVPDIISSALPQPPNIEKVATAKDVLERARNLFVVNPRMERALQRLSENCSKPVLSHPATTPTIPTTPTPSPSPTTSKPALHGVPASLLEKVRAKQAARALEAMTRSPAQAKEAVRLTRLPEIARILRNLFVAEKKGVLTRELVLRKLSDSYRESLSQGELDDHLKLLAEKTPGWVTFCNIRKTDYVKLSRSADMNRVMARLEELAEEKSV